MRVLSAAEVQERMVASLGLDPLSLDLSTVEGIAAALRRAAGFHCPCSPRTLREAVLRPLEGIVEEESVPGAVDDTLEALVAYGDLLEHEEVSSDATEGGRRLLYVAPPSFVARETGAVLLLGIAPDNASPLSEDLAAQVEVINHVRRLPAGVDDLSSRLSELGLVNLSPQSWLRAPSPASPQEHLRRLDDHLEAAPPTVDIPGLTLIDPTRPVRYYRGRWVDSLKETGRFVGRRPQAYGAALWCYVELADGRPQRFVDLPLPKSRWRGCDEAWRLQAAIDAQRGAPQVFRVRPGPSASQILDLFSPVPQWVRRRWDAVGEPVMSTGCLFSYRFRETELQEELSFAREHLWLRELT